MIPVHGAEESTKHKSCDKHKPLATFPPLLNIWQPVQLFLAKILSGNVFYTTFSFFSSVTFYWEAIVLLSLELG